MEHQQTIANSVQLSGRGLFSGEPAQVTLKPAATDTGIVFIRTDFAEPVRIPARISELSARTRRSAVGRDSVCVETIEHCLAAVHGMQIDNLEIEITGPELPNIDGSSDPYTQAILSAGIVAQDKPRAVLVIDEPVMAQEENSLLYALPGNDNELSIIYDLDYTGVPSIGRQMLHLRLTPENFRREISPARTFLPEREAKYFQSQGIGAHLSPREILVLGDNGPVDNELRFPDECVRHKVADLLGDLLLLGRVIRGRIVACRSGHTCNHQLVRKLHKLIDKQQRRKQLSTDAMLDIRKIQKILPHRYPFLLVDRVVEIEGDRRAVGIKNVSMNEQFFQGHFPGTPIMPGVLVVEALAQMSGILFSQRVEHTNQLAVLLSMDKVKMRRAVHPGDQLILEVEAIRVKSRTAHCRCRAMVGDQVAVEAQICFMLVDADE